MVAGRYDLVDLIGRGAMGEVWRGRDRMLRREVAVKILALKQGEPAPIDIERFRFEAQVSALLGEKTKHIVTVHDVGEDPEDGLYLVMEYVEGKTLREELHRIRRMPPARFAALLDQIAAALALAHGAGIVHRDLKPSNLLLIDGADGREMVKVADFGIAKGVRHDLPLDFPQRTKDGFLVGTPSYISPEQFQSYGRVVDARADLWALGVIAYEALTGRAPFAGISVASLVTKLLTRTADPPSRIVPGLPPGLDAWFERALARDPVHRFPSVEAMAEAFRAALAPERAATAGAGAMETRAWTPGALVWGLAGASAVLAVVLLRAALQGPAMESPAPPPEPAAHAAAAPDPAPAPATATVYQPAAAPPASASSVPAPAAPPKARSQPAPTPPKSDVF